MGQKRIDVTGQRYGRLVAISAEPEFKWLCQCDCGNATLVLLSNLRTGQTTSCGCVQRETKGGKFTALDLTGMRFGRLVAHYVTESTPGRHWRWMCECDCGGYKEVASTKLANGDIKSCGCLRREIIAARSTTHGRSGTLEMKMYSAALGRSRKQNVPFDLTYDDIVVPDVCPLLGIPLFVGEGVLGPNSPSLDRIVPTRGYVRGNIWVISFKANQIKSCATMEEFAMILKNWRDKVPDDFDMLL